MTEMNTRFIPAIKSFFIAPANRLDLIAKFPRFKADCYILDLEDGTPEAQKVLARDGLSQVISELRTNGFLGMLGVRVNEPSSNMYMLDLAAAWSADIDFVVIPKLEIQDQLFPAVHGLQFIGQANKRRRWLMGGIESMRGVTNVDRLVTAAPDLVSVYFGAEDFATDLGAIRTPNSIEVLYARSRVVLYAKQAGLNVIDQAIADFRNDELFREDALIGKQMGYDGKICLLPRQVEIANNVFGPTQLEVAYAKRLIAAYEEAVKRGIGTLDFEGQMIDGPLLKRAERVVADAART